MKTTKYVLVFLLGWFFAITGANAQGIVKAEYFFDTDPGAGNGTPIAFAASDSVNITTGTITTTGLAPGYHRLCIRVYGSSFDYKGSISYSASVTGVPTVTGVSTISGNSWSVYESRSFYIQPTVVIATVPGIVAAEYFFDNDPGAGNGLTLPSIANLDSVNVTDDIPIGTLSPGFHKLIVRTKNQDGIWSIYESRSFYVSPAAFTSTVPGIVAAEYFFDSDPGVGNAIALPSIANLDSVNVTDNIPVGTLTSGFHKLIVRTKDQRGVWSIYDARSFYVSPPTFISTTPGIVAAEYFFDTDPGAGNGVALPSIANLDSATVTNNIPVGTLTSGFHKLIIRTKDQRGIWNIYESRSFYISPSVLTPTVPGIVAAEYFFDTDPGVGNGIALPSIANLDSVNVTDTMSIGSLIPGFHRFLVRVKDQRGIWNIYTSQNFYVRSVTGVPVTEKIVAAEYWFNHADPGFGNGTAINIGTAADSINVTTDIDASGLFVGLDTLNVRVKTQSGKYSSALSKPFTICNTAPVASFRTDTVCVGSATTFTNLTTGASGTTTYAWDFNNTGVINSTFAGTVLYTYASSGTFKANLITSNGGPCTTTFTGQVVVVGSVPAQPTAIAGNVSVCKGFQKYFIQRVNDVKYTWNLPVSGNISFSAAKDSAYVNWTGTGSNIALQVVPSNVCGAGLSSTLYVTVNNTVISASAGPDKSICSGDSVKLIASGGSSYLWLNSNQTTTSINVKPQTTTGYIVQVTQGNCTGKDTAFVIVTQSPVLPVITQNKDTLVIDSIQGATYQWSLGGLQVGPNKNKFTPSFAGTYNAKVSVGNCTSPLSAPYNYTPSCIPQSILFNGIPDKFIGDTAFALTSTATSGLPVSYSVSNGAPAVLLPGNILSMTGVGIVGIVASQSGNSTICGAVPVTRYFQVLQHVYVKSSQSITFTGIPNKTIGDPPFKLNALASSGLKVTFSLISGPAIISGDTLKLTTLSGPVIIKASQPGDSLFNAAPDIIQYFNVLSTATGIVKQPQTITFYPIANRVVSDPPFLLTAASTSGLKVQFVVLSGPAYTNGDTVFTNGKGTVSIKAYQTGNLFFLAADSVVQNFTVADVGCTFLPASPVISANSPICTGDDLTIHASNVPGAIYKWTGPGLFTFNGQNFTIPGASFSASGSYRVVASIGNCASVPAYVKVDVKVKPQKPVLTISLGDACKNNSSFSVPAIYGSYRWFYNTYRIANANANIYSPGINGAYYLQVFDSTLTCSNASDSYNFTITGNNQAPVITSLSNETILQSSEAATYRWYLDKRLLVGANGQNIDVLFNGTYKVLATYGDSCQLISTGYSVNKPDLLDIVRSGVIYTDSTLIWPSDNPSIEIYPNPADKFFKVSYKSGKTNKVSCTVLKTDGSYVAHKLLQDTDMGLAADFITDTWPSGIYILKIIDNTTVKWSKVVIY